MSKGRRRFIRSLVTLAALLKLPLAALFAADWPNKAFASTDASDALLELLGTDQTTPSDEISLTLPAVAENGAEVPATISTTLTGVESIHIVVEKNPRPLAMSFTLSERVLPQVICRIKMGETSRVMAVVVTGEGIYSSSKEVRVTLGGCA